MTSRNHNSRSFHFLALWATIGLFAAAAVCGPRTASAETGPTALSQDKSSATAGDVKPTATNSLVAIDRANSATAAENRQPAPRGNGSLILMELRTHRGASKSTPAPAADLDPRTKPLGW